jgi:hypothetical protein
VVLSKAFHPRVRHFRFKLSNSMAHKTLDINDGPLVWIDCEMTGLDPSKNKILEIAVRTFEAPPLVELLPFKLEGPRYGRKSECR